MASRDDPSLLGYHPGVQKAKDDLAIEDNSATCYFRDKEEISRREAEYKRIYGEGESSSRQLSGEDRFKIGYNLERLRDLRRRSRINRKCPRYMGYAIGDRDDHTNDVIHVEDWRERELQIGRYYGQGHEHGRESQGGHSHAEDHKRKHDDDRGYNYGSGSRHKRERHR